MNKSLEPQGWICPKCGKIWAPHIDECPQCNDNGGIPIPKAPDFDPKQPEDYIHWFWWSTTPWKEAEKKY
jgi:hypothetical protein